MPVSVERDPDGGERLDDDPGVGNLPPPEIARIAGSSDHIIRGYTHLKSNAKVSVLILYGLAAEVFAHTAAACYPAVGYNALGSSDHELTIPGGTPTTAGYRTGFYSMNTALGIQYKEVVSSFRHAGQWVPEASDRWKQFRSHPGMFKIQIEREVVVDGISVEASPSVELLGELMQVIETRLAQKLQVKPAK